MTRQSLGCSCKSAVARQVSLAEVILQYRLSRNDAEDVTVYGALAASGVGGLGPFGFRNFSWGNVRSSSGD